MANTNSSSEKTDEDTITIGIVSALGTTFTLILIGYVSKKMRFVSDSAGAGIGEFVGKIALPGSAL